MEMRKRRNKRRETKRSGRRLIERGRERKTREGEN